MAEISKSMLYGSINFAAGAVAGSTIDLLFGSSTSDDFVHSLVKLGAQAMGLGALAYLIGETGFAQELGDSGIYFAVGFVAASPNMVKRTLSVTGVAKARVNTLIPNSLNTSPVASDSTNISDQIQQRHYAQQ